MQAFFAFPYKYTIDYRIDVKRVYEDSNVVAVFGDEERNADALLEKLRELINTCDIGFYDITGFNPNVLLELGFGYASRRHTFFMFDQVTHKKSAAGRGRPLEVPSDLRGRAYFEYRGRDELIVEVRKHLRQSLGIGQNAHLELKKKAMILLRSSDGRRIGEIAKSIGGESTRVDVEAAMDSLRHEGRVDLRGRGLGARYWLKDR